MRITCLALGALWVAVRGVVIASGLSFDMTRCMARCVPEDPVHPTMVRLVGVATVFMLRLDAIVYLVFTDAPVGQLSNWGTHEAVITGWKCRPPLSLTNADLSTLVDTDDEWIRERRAFLNAASVM